MHDLFQNLNLKNEKKNIQNIKDYQPPVDSDPEDVVSEIAPPPKPEGGDEDGEGDGGDGK